jgi:maltose alpha-D-glucosyltransferase/alpha-amylase
LPTNWPQVEGAYQPRNGARTPMQWSRDKNLGFSSGDADKLYLPVDPSPDAPNVAAQETNPQSLLNKTRRLIALHHSEPALANYAEFVPIYPGEGASSPYPFVYARAAGSDVVLVMLNPRAEASDATFNINVKFKKTQLLAGDRFSMEHNKKTGNMTVHMPATSYAIVKLK